MALQKTLNEALLAIDTHLQMLKAVITTKIHLFPLFKTYISYKILISV
jgi:hypothetical protein